MQIQIYTNTNTLAILHLSLCHFKTSPALPNALANLLLLPKDKSFEQNLCLNGRNWGVHRYVNFPAKKLTRNHIKNLEEIRFQVKQKSDLILTRNTNDY